MGRDRWGGCVDGGVSIGGSNRRGESTLPVPLVFVGRGAGRTAAGRRNNFGLAWLSGELGGRKGRKGGGRVGWLHFAFDVVERYGPPYNRPSWYESCKWCRQGWDRLFRVFPDERQFSGRVGAR